MNKESSHTHTPVLKKLHDADGGEVTYSKLGVML